MPKPPQTPDSKAARATSLPAWAEKIVEFLSCTLRCQDVVVLLSRSMDRELPRHQRIALRLHFMMCRCCQRYLRHLRFIHDAMSHFHEHIDEVSGEDLSEEAKQRVKDALKSGR